MYDLIGKVYVDASVQPKKGMNEQEILPIARHFRHTGIIPRFIEYMDAGNANGWLSDEIIPSDEVVDMIHAEMPLERLPPPPYAGAASSFSPAGPSCPIRRFCWPLRRWPRAWC